jgi:hypothetical protein
VRFCDLPAWHEAFTGVRNRYGDRRGEAGRERFAATVKALCARFRLDDVDALWDHLFEGPHSVTALQRQLAISRIRGRAKAGASPREQFMARCTAWAMDDAHRQGGDVVVVCGGWHAPELLRSWAESDIAPESAFPDVPTVIASTATRGSYLVPYSFRRLDSFVGYQSGMPSPAFYDALWEVGAEAACDHMLVQVSQRLRRRRQAVSTADLVACQAMASGLARLRGHAVTTRCDLLDGMAAALVKTALDMPLPWAQRGTLRAGTDPLLVEIIAALSGEHTGALSAATPQPPLLADSELQLRGLGIAPQAEPRDFRVHLAHATGREQSRVLHRLRVLAIPGFDRLSGPDSANAATLEETWRISSHDVQASALIEASIYGATLESAALARVEEMLLDARGQLAELARC